MTDPFNTSPGKDKKSKQVESRLKEQGELDNFGNFLLDEDGEPLSVEGASNAEQVYKAGLDYFYEQGYKLVPAPQGIAANHNVFKLDEPPKIDGLSLPQGYKVWKQIFRGSAYNLFLYSVQDFISEDPETRKLWAPLTSPISNKSSTLYALALNHLQAESQEQLQSTGRPISLGIEPNPSIPKVGQNISEIAPRAFVPPREWFSPNLQEVTLDDLFTILPPNERNLFSLIIGRALVGRNNSLTASGNLINHTARMAAVLCGPAGLGKSTLFEALWSAIAWAGYTKRTIKNIDARFNIGKVATADVIYKDDTSQKEIRKLFESSTAKTIITSNDVLSVEDKGEDAYEVVPIGTMFLNANEFNPRDTFSMDPGMADRIKILATVTNTEAQELSQKNKSPRIIKELALGPLAIESPDALPWFHLDWLSDKLKVSKLALMLWALRLCADKFLELIQPTTNDQNQPVNLLASAVKQSTLFLRIPLYKEVTQQIISAAYVCSRINTTSEIGDITKQGSRPEYWLTFSKRTKFLQSYFELRTSSDQHINLDFLKWHFENIMPNWAYHPYLGLKNTSPFFTTKAYQEASEIVAIDGRGEFDKVLHFFKTIRASNGVEVSADPVWVLQAANDISGMQPILDCICEMWSLFSLLKPRVTKEGFEYQSGEESNFKELIDLALNLPSSILEPALMMATDNNPVIIKQIQNYLQPGGKQLSLL
jgi:hypothetical protein